MARAEGRERSIVFQGSGHIQPWHVAEIALPATLAHMGIFTAHTSRLRTALPLLICIAFVALGLWMIGVFGPAPTSRRFPAPLPVMFGWLILLSFGFNAIMWLRKLLTGGIQLEVGLSGIRWRSWSDEFIPWSEIIEVKTWNYQGQRSIVLTLNDVDRFPRRGFNAFSVWLNRTITGGDICISLKGANRSFDEAMSAIAHFKSVEPRQRLDLIADHS